MNIDFADYIESERFSLEGDLEYLRWLEETQLVAKYHANSRNFYCDNCGWCGVRDDPREVAPCPECGAAMADVDVEEF